ncbi:hypothetical protein ACFOEZ_01120 [Tianweitania populi]|uniref:Quinol:cytochrome C oxidoreductase n=1 Tax=Tianweitania populi TaxID=1607949 RepID=A0A8J3DQY0_9HYPH|nr:hypothetical protein [Tianweitania populi]GHD05013.1 hypothetical protein GCM10016234_00370 [Tianweitania populi]
MAASITAFPVTTRSRLGLLTGLICLAVALVSMVLQPEAALQGWLTGFCFLSDIAFGGLILASMMRLIPGLWDDELERFSDAVAALLPFAALAFLPILIGAAWLYDWQASADKGVFRELWMTLPFWTVRAILFLLFASVSALLMVRRQTDKPALPITALVIYTAGFMVIAVDWYLFLDPEAHFSGFSLTRMSVQFLGALCVSIMMAVSSAAKLKRPEILGSLLMAALLAWAYFAFMQYFITWSDNLPFGVRWYGERGAGLWGLLEVAFTALRLAPLLLLLATPIRQSRRWLFWLSAAVLFGNALETLWLIAPAGGHGTAVLPWALLSLFGLTLLAAPRLASRAARAKEVAR